MDGASGQLERGAQGVDRTTAPEGSVAADTALHLDLRDLYLLVTFAHGVSRSKSRAKHSEPAGIDANALAAAVDALTGPAKLLAEHGTSTKRRTSIADWQLSAVERGFLYVSGSKASVIHADPALAITPQGRAALVDAFGAGFLSVIEGAKSSATLERLLVARALGLPASAGATRLKRLDTAGGLRAAVVRRGWALRIPESATSSQIRNALAARALGSAFGKALERQIGTSNRLSAKAGRAIAAQLLETRRHVSGDARLMTALAAQHLEIANADLKGMRQALIRRHFSGGKGPLSRIATQAVDAPTACHKVQSTDDQATLDPAANTTASPAATAPSRSALLRAVRRAAKKNATGWSGNRKAYISHVWRAVCDSHPEWGLDAATFKDWLTNAHRDGALALVNADLRDKNNMRDVQASAISHRNTQWHCIQVPD
ncbi:MAG: hypothetical protein AAFZ01_01255 [Pseudomonadota bacterium]